MVDKLLKTKIALKQNTYAYWTTGEGKDYIPLYGEVCLCEVSDAATATTAPTVLFKVGTAKKNADGSYVTGTAKKFSELNWVSALAADVYSWAKKTETEFLQWILPTINNAVAAKEELTSSVANGVTTIAHDKKLNKTFTGTAATGSVNEAGKSVTIKVPKLTVNEYGHVTAAEEVEYTVTLPGIMPANDGKLTLKTGGGLAGDTKTFSADQATNVEFEVTHGAKPTSGNAQAATAGSGRTYVTEVLVDDYGHIAGVKTATETDQIIPEETEITITDKTNTNTEDEVYAVTNLVEGGTKGHTITPTYTVVPTKGYVDKKVAAAVAGAVDYLGTVSAAENLGKNESGTTITIGKGDFYRASAAFDLGSEKVHVGDMLIAIVDNPGATAANWDVGHLEIDTDTWTENSDTAAGYVAATGGTTNAGKVWKVGSDGKPAWLADNDTDTHHQATNIVGASDTAKENAAVTKATNSIYLNLIENGAVRSSHNIVGAGATKVYSDANGKVTIESENTWNALSASQDGYVPKEWYYDLYNFANKWDVLSSGGLNSSTDGVNIVIDTDEGIGISTASSTAFLYPTFIRVSDTGKDFVSLYKDKITHKSASTNTTYNYTLPLASGELVLAGQEDIVYVLDCN